MNLYDEIILLISQTSTTKPTQVVLKSSGYQNPQNLLTWSRLSTGKYKLTRVGGFDAARTAVSVPLGAALYVDPNYVRVTYDVDKQLLVETWGPDTEYLDGVLNEFALEIRTYFFNS